MITCLTAILLGVLIAALVSAYIVSSLTRQYEARLHDAHSQLARAYDRIQFLELTIDEVRARELSTSLPPVPAQPATKTALPDEVKNELLQIEDPDHRAELEESARYAIEQNPEADPREIIDQLFI